MQLKISKTLEGLIARAAFNTTKAGMTHSLKDFLALEMLHEEGSLAYQLLTARLREWELHQIRLRIEHEIRRPHAAGGPSPEVFYRRFTDELLSSIPDARNLSTIHALAHIVADRTTVTSRTLEMYGVTAAVLADELRRMLEGGDPANDSLRELDPLKGSVRNNRSEVHPGDRDGEPSHDDKAADEHPDHAANHSGGWSDEPRREHPEGHGGWSAGLSEEAAGGTGRLLDRFGTDLTRQAREGRIDPVVGRDAEIERVVQILSRRKKNNPILIGEAGVGKSAIVEGLARRIVRGEVPYTLAGKRLFALDIASVVAGTKFRGEFEERMQQLLDELRGARDTILFIDEIHTIVGAGATQGSLDTANLLKPALARGEIRLIGATTLDEYRTDIESDAALERRFQRVVVEAPTADETLRILRNIAPDYERHHRVRFTEEALRACVDLADRYLTERCFPDKAIDLLDEAGSRAHLQAAGEPLVVRQLEEAVREARREAVEAVERLVYEQAAGARLREKALRQRLDEERAAWQRRLEAHPTEIGEEQIRQVVSTMTGIPLERLTRDEQQRLQQLGDHLTRRVIGQPEAVDRIARTIRRARAGLKDERRPIGVFLFVGPTGVGKTLLAKEVSRWLFDERRGLIRIDMSEYAEKHNVARLFGAPPGYVGYGEGGQLTEAVRRRPHAVVLFDEIEKAHPEVFNTLLQLLDEGHLTDGAGRRVDFRNTILIMTSNVGSQAAARRPVQVGYATVSKQESAARTPETEYRRALEQTFPPEFLNRIDDIVLFRPLEIRDVERIVDLELQGLLGRTRRLGYRLRITRGARRRLAAMGYEARYGARALKRTLTDQVEEPLSSMIIDGRLREGDTVVVESDRSGGVRLRVA